MKTVRQARFGSVKLVIAGILLICFCAFAVRVSSVRHQSKIADTTIRKTSSPDQDKHEQVVAFSFGLGYPDAHYSMSHDNEAIITLRWNQNTWAHIENFTSKVYAGEATVLELEEPKAGVYPLTLDSGEVLGTVKVY
jgi:hypothetical protein